jgi:hypothetical protein
VLHAEVGQRQIADRLIESTHTQTEKKRRKKKKQKETKKTTKKKREN